MKKTFFSVMVAAALMLHAGSAAAQAFRDGDNILAAGIGIGGSYAPGSFGSSIPALSVQYEHGNWAVGGPGVISLGGYLGYKSYTYDYRYAGYDVSEKWSYTIIGLRSAYHYNGLDAPDWDLYGGLMLSYDILSYSFESNIPSSVYHGGDYGSRMHLSLYLGARYFVSQNVAVFAELGYGISNFTLGAAFRL